MVLALPAGIERTLYNMYSPSESKNGYIIATTYYGEWTANLILLTNEIFDIIKHDPKYSDFNSYLEKIKNISSLFRLCLCKKKF